MGALPSVRRLGDPLSANPARAAGFLVRPATSLARDGGHYSCVGERSWRGVESFSSGGTREPCSAKPASCGRGVGPDTDRILVWWGDAGFSSSGGGIKP